MKNADNRPAKMAFANIWQRLISVGLMAFFLYLIYLAVNGRFDTEINRFAAWLEHLLS